MDTYMVDMLIYYVVGYFITLFGLIMFGKELGFDYDVEKTYANYDDWSSNKTAYPGISFVWMFLWVFGFFRLIWILLTSLTGLLLKLKKRKYEL